MKESDMNEIEEPENKVDLLKLKTIGTLISDEIEQEKMKSIMDIISEGDNNDNDNDKIFSKFLYIVKDIIFILILLISSGLNFSYLYFPFFLIAFLSYFSLFNSGKNNKNFKKILEIITLVYSIGLLVFKLYFTISIREGKDFSDNKKLLLDLGNYY